MLMINFIKYSIRKPYRIDNTLRAFARTQIFTKNNFLTSRVNLNMKREVNSEIILNDTEVNIRNLLIAFCDYYNSKVTEDKKLELRITGGWVRDKLLGLESNDLDIAINHLSGEEFASSLHDYLNDFQPELKLKAIHTIKKNPEKSKHLETCTTKLFGLDIDFVNLRSEQYSSDSRVPIIECGTAEEDALRRDATLNALFYNLNKDKIEDFTGRGMQDLKDGILRTPLQPLQTFIDDPLRALRLIRFASRFDFLVEDETLKAMKNDEIKSTLINKISRERVGVELEKILTSKNPQYGLDLVRFTNLTESIFSLGSFHDAIYATNDSETLAKVEDSFSLVPSQIEIATNVYPSFAQYIQSLEPNHLSDVWKHIFQDKQLQKIFWLSVILQPFGDLAVRTSPKKPQFTHIPEILLKEGLRFGKHEFDTVSTIIKVSTGSGEVLNRFFAGEEVKRSELGLFLREFGPFANLALVYNCFINTLQSMGLPHPSSEPPKPQSSYITLPQSIETVATSYNSLLLYIDTNNLQDIYSMKPLVDGKTLSKALSMKPGPWMGKINAQILIWQLDNPHLGKEDCIEYIKSILPQYT